MRYNIITRLIVKHPIRVRVGAMVMYDILMVAAVGGTKGGREKVGKRRREEEEAEIS